MKNKFILKNSFDSIIMRHNLMRNEDFETIEQCVNVSDNFAIYFGEWLMKKGRYNITNWSKTTKELLEIFKQQNHESSGK